MGLIVVLQIAAGVLVVVFNEELGDELEAEMSEQVKYHVTNDTEDPLTAAWNVVQVEVRVRSYCAICDYVLVLLTIGFIGTGEGDTVA